MSFCGLDSLNHDEHVFVCSLLYEKIQVYENVSFSYLCFHDHDLSDHVYDHDHDHDHACGHDYGCADGYESVRENVHDANAPHDHDYAIAYP